MLCLTVATDPRWATLALAQLDTLLIDHAHCELKAASNALSLIGRHPDHLELSLALSALANEELDHFRRVVEVLRARGLALGAPPVDEYAVLLRRAVARLPGRHDERLVLVDRLLVGAVIEARSAERFQLITQAMRDSGHADAELLAFYDELFACEARHFRVYSDLAKQAYLTQLGPHEHEARERAGTLIKERLARLAQLEGQMLEERGRDREGPSPTVHG